MINTDKLKARLKEKRMTQEQLAKKLGIHLSTLNAKINNEVGETLTIKQADDIKKILDIPHDEVIEYFFK